jgi:DNA-binding beta-propeller fold protein YncE
MRGGTRRPKGGVGLVSALAWLTWLALGSTPAQGAYEHAFSFGTPGSGQGELSAPHGIAVGPDGDVFVADQDNDRIQVFGPDGAFIREWGSSGSGNGELSAPRGIAVSPAGEVYVADRLNDRVQVFSPTGTYLRKWGSPGTASGRFNSPGWVDLDAAGNVYVTDTFNYRVQVFTSQGVPLGQFGSQGGGAGQFSLLSGIAVTGDGVYVADHASARLQLFTTTGTLISELGGLTHPGLLVNPWGIAEDTTESLLVGELAFATGGAPVGVTRISRTGAPLDGFGPQGTGDGDLSQPRDIAVASNGDVYVTDADLSRVKVFTPTGVGGPQTAIESGPSGPINTTAATFGFSSPTAGARFECSLDAGTWAACSSPHDVTGLQAGGHSLAVRAVAGGLTDQTPAVRTFTVDLEPPDPPTIDTDAADPSPGPDVEFALSGEQSASFECRLDDAPLAPCAALRSYAGLGEGQHTFEARQTDAAGNVGETGRFSWRIDLTPPDTSVSSAPDEWIASTSATFEYSSGEQGSTFACTLDGSPAACSAPSTTLTGLSQGEHTFTVRAVDAAGNEDPSPEGRSFNVDSLAPAAPGLTGPSGTVASSSALLDVAAEPGATVECALDADPLAACPAQNSYAALADGAHQFRARQTDRAGNVSPIATRAWTVDTVPNEPPVAKAIAKRIVPFLLYKLDGHGSFDPDGEIAAYEWRASRKSGDPGAVVSTAPSLRYRNRLRRTYVTLTVTDVDGASATGSLVLKGRR